MGNHRFPRKARRINCQVLDQMLLEVANNSWRQRACLGWKLKRQQVLGPMPSLSASHLQVCFSLAEILKTPLLHVCYPYFCPTVPWELSSCCGILILQKKNIQISSLSMLFSIFSLFSVLESLHYGYLI